MTIDKDIEEALYGITHNPDHVLIPNWSREAAGFPKISKGTIGEKMMNREYNGLGVANDESIKRFNGPEKLKDTYEKGDYFRAEVLGFEYDLVFERDFWYDLDDKTSEYGLEFRIIW